MYVTAHSFVMLRKLEKEVWKRSWSKLQCLLCNSPAINLSDLLQTNRTDEVFFYPKGEKVSLPDKKPLCVRCCIFMWVILTEIKLKTHVFVVNVCLISLSMNFNFLYNDLPCKNQICFYFQILGELKDSVMPRHTVCFSVVWKQHLQFYSNAKLLSTLDWHY